MVLSVASAAHHASIPSCCWLICCNPRLAANCLATINQQAHVPHSVTPTLLYHPVLPCIALSNAAFVVAAATAAATTAAAAAAAAAAAPVELSDLKDPEGVAQTTVALLSQKAPERKLQQFLDSKIEGAWVHVVWLHLVSHPLEHVIYSLLAFASDSAA